METAVHLQIIEAIRVYVLVIDNRGESRIIEREKRFRRITAKIPWLGIYILDLEWCNNSWARGAAAILLLVHSNYWLWDLLR